MERVVLNMLAIVKYTCLWQTERARQITSYRQDRARTFNLPRHGAVMHFNGSGAVLHHLLVQASGVFVKRRVSRLIPR